MGFDEDRRRASLTPLSGELRFDETPAAREPRRLRLLLRWRRRSPITRPAAIARGLLSLGLVLAIFGGGSVLIARLAGRPAHVGLYVGGALLAASAFFTSAASDEPYYIGAEERELRVRRGFVYALVGFCLIGIGVLLEATR